MRLCKTLYILRIKRFIKRRETGLKQRYLALIWNKSVHFTVKSLFQAGELLLLEILGSNLS